MSEEKKNSWKNTRGILKPYIGENAMSEEKAMTLKEWIENEQGVEWKVIVAHTIPEHHLPMEMENIYDNPGYFNFYLWSEDYVYHVYPTDYGDYGWEISFVPRNPPKPA